MKKSLFFAVSLFIIFHELEAMSPGKIQEAQKAKIASLKAQTIKVLVKNNFKEQPESFIKFIENQPNELKELFIIEADNLLLTLLAYYTFPSLQNKTLNDLIRNQLLASLPRALSKATSNGASWKTFLNQMVPAKILENKELKFKLSDQLRYLFFPLQKLSNVLVSYSKDYGLFFPAIQKYSLPLNVYADQKYLLEEIILIAAILSVQNKLLSAAQKSLDRVNNPIFLTHSQGKHFAFFLDNLSNLVTYLPRAPISDKIQSDIKILKKIVSFGSGNEEADHYLLKKNDL